MKIAIIDGQGPFTKLWTSYCIEHNIDYIHINPYDNNIIGNLADCNIVLWHFHHSNYKDNLFAKQLLISLQQSGKKVFPNLQTNWHFDDKIGQKYLLESIGAPIVPSFVFYDRISAFTWLKSARFPIVFKLSSGAGGANVHLVQTLSQAKRLINRAFGKGFASFNRIRYFKERLNKFIHKRDTLVGVFKGFGRLFIPIKNSHLLRTEKGYVYFQKFIPNNKSDTRVIVIGNKAFAIKRFVRENDFRASGSGMISHKKEDIDIRCVKISFEVSAKLNSQCLAYDFVIDQENQPRIVEISYGFSPSGYIDCPGYWDETLFWHETVFNPYGWIIDNLIQKVK